MKKTSLLFGVHMHQPVDNFGESVDEAIQLCYAPFFETMIKYPEFKFAIHCSGWLLDQIRTKHPKIFQHIKELTSLGSVEWVSAGYYEPVLCAIPPKDRQAQINKLSDYIKEHLSYTPKGLWLTERVWESSIIPDLKSCGIKYALVDDYHFLSSGYDRSKMDGYYTTEEGGDKLSLFPISKSLRYALPFYSVDRAVDEILKCSQNEDSAAIIFDDAEKFGLWPKTHKWVYEQKWLEKFIEAVLKHPQITTEHYSDYLEKNHSRSLAYLNNTSYIEMGEWSLKSEQTIALEELKDKLGSEYFNKLGVVFIKGGVWKNFLVKYHESNYLHKRMLHHSLKQDKLSASTKDSLYKLQTNDVLWHGVFGGLYLPNLRDNAYKYLLEIEREYAKDEISYSYEDIDQDSYKELKVLTKSHSFVFSSRWGAQMVEFGSLDALFNWQNTLMRRKEAYHKNILDAQNIDAPIKSDKDTQDEIETIHHALETIDPSLIDELVYDWHPKYSFVDHFSTSEFTLDSFKHLSFGEVGDFANGEFKLSDDKIFTRDGGIYLDNTYDTKLTKEYSFTNNNISLNLGCVSVYKAKLFYATEFNFHFAHPDLVTINDNKLNDGIELFDINEIVIIDSFTQKKISIITNKKSKLSAYILNTVSQSESGFDKVAQQISFILSTSFESNLNLQLNIGVSNV